MLHGAHHSFGLGKWDVGPISLPLSVAPQPLCTECVGKGCNSSATVVISTCLLGDRLTKACSPSHVAR